MTEEKDLEFVRFIISQIVEKPDEIKLTRVVDEMGVLITLEVNKEDMGKIIGKGGQTAKAIRTLLRIIGSKNNARVNLKIVEPNEA
ncbi:KH domain-containing protein [Candidatus Peregrinibacteria bacterium]|nr:KH domain-containing protein [Candidatus Peregrinibacteria bacterium]